MRRRQFLLALLGCGAAAGGVVAATIEAEAAMPMTLFPAEAALGELAPQPTFLLGASLHRMRRRMIARRRMRYYRRRRR